MTDKQTENENPEGTEGGEDDRESAFWKRFDERLDAGVKRAIDTHLKPGGQRTGRTTLPGVIADMFFGKAPQK